LYGWCFFEAFCAGVRDWRIHGGNTYLDFSFVLWNDMNDTIKDWQREVARITKSPFQLLQRFLF
jgi:hypothetical protein